MLSAPPQGQCLGPDLLTSVRFAYWAAITGASYHLTCAHDAEPLDFSCSHLQACTERSQWCCSSYSLCTVSLNHTRDDHLERMYGEIDRNSLNRVGKSRNREQNMTEMPRYSTCACAWQRLITLVHSEYRHFVPVCLRCICPRLLPVRTQRSHLGQVKSRLLTLMTVGDRPTYVTKVTPRGIRTEWRSSLSMYAECISRFGRGLRLIN